MGLCHRDGENVWLPILVACVDKSRWLVDEWKLGLRMPPCAIYDWKRIWRWQISVARCSLLCESSPAEPRSCTRPQVDHGEHVALPSYQ